MRSCAPRNDVLEEEPNGDGTFGCGERSVPRVPTRQVTFEAAGRRPVPRHRDHRLQDGPAGVGRAVRPPGPSGAAAPTGGREGTLVVPTGPARPPGGHRARSALHRVAGGRLPRHGAHPDDHVRGQRVRGRQRRAGSHAGGRPGRRPALPRAVCRRRPAGSTSHPADLRGRWMPDDRPRGVGPQHGRPRGHPDLLPRVLHRSRPAHRGGVGRGDAGRCPGLRGERDDHDRGAGRRHRRVGAAGRRHRAAGVADPVRGAPAGAAVAAARRPATARESPVHRSPRGGGDDRARPHGCGSWR